MLTVRKKKHDRLWYIERYVNHRKPSILNGKVVQWIKEGLRQLELKRSTFIPPLDHKQLHPLISRNFRRMISILTTISNYSCFFEMFFRIVGSYMQTDAYKIFELVTVIGFGILLLSDIKNIENESLFWIASLQIVLSGTYIFFYLVSSLSTLIRGTEPDHYNSKELDIYCAVGEIYVLTYASLIQNCRSGGSCSNTYFGGLVFLNRVCRCFIP